MANWGNPTVTSNYVTFVDEVKARDVDAICLQNAALVAPPQNSVRLLRAPVKFQEYIGAAFVDRVLAVEGGGTGTTSLAGFIGSMGLGSMAYQNSPNVSITGGLITNVGITGGYLNSAAINSCTISGGSINSLTMAGNITYNAGYTFTINSNISMNGSVISIVPNPSNWGISITGGVSYGLNVACGSISGHTILYITNAAGVAALMVRGDLAVWAPNAFVLPVGPNKYPAP